MRSALILIGVLIMAEPSFAKERIMLALLDGVPQERRRALGGAPASGGMRTRPSISAVDLPAPVLDKSPAWPWPQPYDPLDDDTPAGREMAPKRRDKRPIG